MTDSIVTIKKMSFYRGERAIFKEMDLRIPKGKVTVVMGPSGTGKTTLLRLMTGQIKPSAGSIDVLGQSVPDLKRSALYTLRERLAMLFQANALFTNLSVFDNVAYPLREYAGLPESLIHKIVLMKLNAVGLRGAAKLMPSELSGGMARRVSLARSLAKDPEVILYDEPFTGQDPISMGVLAQLVRTLNDALGMTSILVSHDVKICLEIADHVCLLAGGKVVGEGAPEEVIKTNSPEIKQFLSGLPDGPVPFHFPADDYQQDLLGDD